MSPRMTRAFIPTTATLTLIAVACSSEPSRSVSTDAGASDAATPAKDAARADAGPALTGALAWCERLKSKMLNCDAELECGVDFDAWCAKQATTNSRAFESTDTGCVETTCKSSERSKCRYPGYASIGMSAAGEALASAYCATCTEVPGCAASIRTYDGQAVSDAFVAAWELSDAIINDIRTQCTGAALTITGGDCVKSFGSCAANIYLSALPVCPK